MSTITTTPAGLDHRGGAALGDAVPGAGFVTATGQAAKRSILQALRSPQLLVLPTVIGALFLLIFRYVFGGAIEAGQGVDYVDYLVPGFVVQSVLWTGMNFPAGVAEDAASGVYDRFRSLPIPRTAVVAGRSLADAGLVIWTLAVTLGLGFAVGFRTHADLPSILAACALMLGMSYVFTWLFISLGLVAGNAQAAQGMASLLVIPLSFLSSAFVPVDAMPGWLQPVAEHQPITAFINAVRSLMLGGTDAAGVGHTTGWWVGISLAWCAGILLVFSAFAVRRFARTR
jgi:ABC-2 type transport system permease protein